MKKLNRWFSDRNINYKKYLILIYVVLIMIPVLIVISVNDPGRSTLAKTLASVFLLVFFVLFFIYDYRKKVAGDWGIIALSVGGDVYKDAAERLATAKNVKLIATSDFDRLYDVIADNMSHDGCRYEILLMNPYSEFASLNKMDDNNSYSDKFEKLAAESQNEIIIKHYSLMPIDNILIIDDNVFVYPLTQKLSDGRQLCKCYKGKKKGFEYYNNVFKRTWEHPVNENASDR